MKTYGLILADNGSNWYFGGTADRRWTDTMVDQLKQIPARAFQAVDERCLMVAPNSGQAWQPGTLAYDRRCTERPLRGRDRPHSGHDVVSERSSAPAFEAMGQRGSPSA